MAASITKTVQKPRVQQARTHDYLYDPDYTLSSGRDHARDTFKAHTSIDRVKRVPNFKTMFSELRHYPRQSFQLDRTDPVPRWVDRGWRGFHDQLRGTMRRFTTFNYAPDVILPGHQSEDPQVSGANRYKYFSRPIIPFLQQVHPSIVLQQAPQASQASASLFNVEETGGVGEPLTRTVGVQTMYRESETQTDPYSPEYVIRPGSQPELLTLATLSYGHGLPAGLAEVEMIERARAKRAWEATLPPLNDTEMHEKRRQMLDEQETKEWAFREGEIERIQEARLKVLERMLSERESEHDQLNTRRLEHLWYQKQQAKELRVKQIRTKHVKALRKLTKKRENVEGKLQRRDVITDYAQFASQTYAPLTRIGVFMDRNSEQYNVHSRLLSTYDGLLELEASLPDFIVQPRMRPPRTGHADGGAARKKQRRVKQLEDVDEAIRIGKAKGAESPKLLRLLEKVEKPIPRPPTPTQPVPSAEEEEQELAVIQLQQLIRGRAIQNIMFEGKQRRLDLIHELRSTHALQSAGQKEKEAARRAAVAAQEMHTRAESKDAAIEKMMQDMTGEQLGKALDFLSKELIRLEEERRIHAFVKLAERERKLREAEESGLRQVEERRRREEDEIFRQIVNVNQATIDTYLEDLILNSADTTADEQSREEIRRKAEAINCVAHEMEGQRTKLQSEEMVAQLVHTFLLPEVEKQTMREKLKHDQRKHILAAHKIIHQEGEDIIGAHRVPPPPLRAKSASAPLSCSDSSTSQTGLEKKL